MINVTLNQKKNILVRPKVNAFCWIHTKHRFKQCFFQFSNAPSYFKLTNILLNGIKFRTKYKLCSTLYNLFCLTFIYMQFEMYNLLKVRDSLTYYTHACLPSNLKMQYICTSYSSLHPFDISACFSFLLPVEDEYEVLYF